MNKPTGKENNDLGESIKKDFASLTKEKREQWVKLAKGFFTCLKNAEELMEESKILLEKQRLSRSMALLILSAEELGKALHMSEEFFHFGTPYYEKFREQRAAIFRSHLPKLENVFVLLFRTDIRRDFQVKDMRESWNELKKMCLYVGNLEDDDFLAPYTPSKKWLGDFLKKYEERFYSAAYPLKLSIIQFFEFLGVPVGKIDKMEISKIMRAVASVLGTRKGKQKAD